MIRRTFLKIILASPLAGLLKKPEGLKVKQLLECKAELDRKPCLSTIVSTTGTEGGPIKIYLGADEVLTVPVGKKLHIESISYGANFESVCLCGYIK